MQLLKRSRTLLAGLTIGVVGGAFAISSGARAPARQIPERLSDSAFWRLVTEISEPGGYFHSDNFVSNEAEYQYVIPDLQPLIKSGGVYVGVGPDQNFTYLVAFRPEIAFIVDIRRQNMMQHLLYKALIELSADRAAFLSRLFSRARPRGVDTSYTAAQLMQAFDSIQPDEALFHSTFRDVLELLRDRRGFSLQPDDIVSIEYVFGAFYTAGPHLTYSFGQGRSSGAWGMPTFGYLQTETDGAGVARGYLATEANYRVLRDLQTRNLVVPLVGNFAGDKALRSVARYVRERNAVVSIFYTSNVEQYLFRQDDEWYRFYSNLAALPVNETSTLIRSVSNGRWVRSRNPRSRSAQLTSPIERIVEAFRAGRLLSYADAIALSR